MTIASDVRILAEGGSTRLPGSHGGAGGTVRIVNLEESDGTALSFTGDVLVSGGRDALGSGSTDGTICVAGSNTASNIQLVGANNFPIVNCSSDDTETLVVHDLDCDDATIRPDEVTTELPVVIGLDFYRVVVTAGMIADAVDTITIAVTGADGGNIDLFAGPEGALGSTDTGDYTVSSTEADSSETLDFDISGLAAGDFVSVLVFEQFTLVEEYSITVSCGS